MENQTEIQKKTQRKHTGTHFGRPNPMSRAPYACTMANPGGGCGRRRPTLGSLGPAENLETEIRKQHIYIYTHTEHTIALKQHILKTTNIMNHDKDILETINKSI